MSSAVVRESEQGAPLSDTALAALGLERQPFSADRVAGEDPAAGSFVDERRTERLAEIRQSLIAGDDLLLVLGERGAGKSTLLAQLASDSGLRIQCFSVRGGPRFSTLNLFSGMLEAFKVRAPEQLKETLDELIPCLQAMIGNNTLCVVVLDDADAVPADELTTLLSAMLYLDSGDETLLRIVLAAPPAFEEILPERLPRGADLPYSSLVLEPYDLQRAGLYLAHRLEQAGLRGEFPFDEAELTAINARAGGRPAALHAAAAAALEARWGESAGAVASGTGATGEGVGEDGPFGRSSGTGGSSLLGGIANGRTARLALGSLAALMILGGLLLFRPGPAPEDSESRYRVVEERRLETERLRLIDEEDGDTPVDVAATSAADAGETSGSAVPSETPSAPSSDEVPAGEPAPDAEPAPAPLPDVAPPAGTTTDVPSGAGTEEPAPDPSPAAPPSATPDPDPVPEPAPEPTSEPEAEPAPELEPPAPQTSATDPDPAPDTADAPDTAPESGPRSDAALLGEDGDAEEALEPSESVLESPNWILVQDAELFTVQMIASTDRGAIEAFLGRAELDPPNSIFSFDRRGTTWYALVHGLFPSIEAARAEVERMPPAALTDQPWIRAVGRVQNSLREQD